MLPLGAWPVISLDSAGATGAPINLFGNQDMRVKIFGTQGGNANKRRNREAKVWKKEKEQEKLRGTERKPRKIEKSIREASVRSQPFHTVLIQ